jgi:hypothetical protein
VEEAHGSELSAARRSGTRASERRPDRAQEDAEHGTRDAHVVVQVRTEALRHREHPLPCGDVRQHVVGEVSRDLARGTHRRWVACVTGGADAPALARERDQPLVAALLTARPREPVREDAALEIGAEVALDPRGHAFAQGVGLGRLGEERLEVVLDDRIEGRLGRTARAIDGARRGPARHRARGRGRQPVLAMPSPDVVLRQSRHAAA